MLFNQIYLGGVDPFQKHWRGSWGWRRVWILLCQSEPHEGPAVIWWFHPSVNDCPHDQAPSLLYLRTTTHHLWQNHVRLGLEKNLISGPNYISYTTESYFQHWTTLRTCLPNELNMDISRDTSEYGFIDKKSKTELVLSPMASPTWKKKRKMTAPLSSRSTLSSKAKCTLHDFHWEVKWTNTGDHVENVYCMEEKMFCV